MSLKKITLTQDAHVTLESWKVNEEEDFSHVICRLGQKISLSAFRSALTKKSAKYLVDSVKRNRKLWAKSRVNSLAGVLSKDKLACSTAEIRRMINDDKAKERY